MDDATINLINKEFVPLSHYGWGFGEVLTARGEVVAVRLIAGDTGGPDGPNNPMAPKRLRQALYHDFLWMTRDEWQSLVPERPRVGDSFTAPPFLVARIALNHAQLVTSACALK